MSVIEKVDHSWVNNAWLGLGDVSQIQRINPLKQIRTSDLAMSGLHEARLMKNPEYLSFACKALLNIDLIPDQAVVLEEIWKRPFPMLVCSRGFSKSFLMALYAMLRCIFHDGTKVIIVGAAFRQSRIIYEYMETMWRNAPVYRSLCDSNSGPKRDVDRCTMKINNSTAMAIPIGSGEKIRGLRANIILCDEFKCLSYNTLVETNKGLLKIGQIIENKEDVLVVNRYGQLEKPDQYIRTPLTDVYKITTRYGYSFKCSNIHTVLTDKGWKLAKDLEKNDYLVFDNYNKFQKEQIDNLDVKLAWLLGFSVAEGSCTSNNVLSVYTTDIEQLNKIKKDYEYLKPKVYERQAYVDKRGKALRDNFYQLGLEYVTSHKKQIPWSILQSPRKVVISFLKGLFTGDGSAFIYETYNKKWLGVGYYSVSEELIDELQVLLRKLGYFASKVRRDSNISNNDQWMLSLRGEYAYNLAIELNIDKWQDLLESQDLYF